MAPLPSPTRRGRIYIKRWVEPKAGEPAHGHFQRVALANHQDSAAAFGRTLDLAEPNDAEGCLLAVSGYARAPAADLANLRRWTPRFDGFLGVVGGQTIRRDDWTTGYRRFCSACLAEDAYHRTWFDLTFVHRCPFHGTPVSDLKADGQRANFATAETAFSPAGVLLAVPAPRLDATPDTIEAYAVGRLGLMPFEETPFLAAATLAEVVAASDVLGRLALDGWRELTPQFGKDDGEEAAAAQAAGFAVLRRGREGVKALLRDVARAAPPTTFGVKALYGWLMPLLRQRDGLHWMQLAGRRAVDGRFAPDGSPIRPEGGRTLFGDVVDLGNEVAVELGRHARREIRAEATRASEAMTMSEVGAMVDMTYDAVLNLAGALGLILPHPGGQGVPYLMRRADVPRIVETVKGSVTRGEAAAMLGVGYDVFLPLARAFGIPKVGSRWGQVEDGSKSGYEDRFERRVLTEFLDSIPTEEMSDFWLEEHPRPWPDPISVAEILELTDHDPVDFCKALMAGRIAVERTGRGRGLRDFEVWPNQLSFALAFTKRCMSGRVTRGRFRSGGMTTGEAATVLEVAVSDVKALQGMGHFGVAGDAGKRRLDREAVTNFFQRYAPGRLYADALGSGPNAAARLLKKRGIPPAIQVVDPDARDPSKVLTYFFDREGTRQALGLTVDPEAVDGARVVWKRLAGFLGQNQSVFAIRSFDGEKAELRTANVVWPITVGYEFEDGPEPGAGEYAYAIVARLRLDGDAFRRMREDLIQAIGTRDLWPEMEVDFDPDADRLSVRLAVRMVHYGRELAPERLKERRMDFVARCGADDVEVIEHMLHMIKGGLEPSDRAFDRRTFGAWSPERMRPWADDEHRCAFVSPERRYKIVA